MTSHNTRAYLITYLGPTNTRGARLAFDNPMGKRRYIPRDYEICADEQARKLAEATPGFIAFGPLDNNLDKWVYITNGEQS